MYKSIQLLFVTAMLSACNNEGPQGTDTSIDAEAVGLRSGVDIQGMNQTARPQDDFFEYANGTWLAETEIPGEEIGWGGYMTLRKEALEQSRAIVEELLEQGSDLPHAQMLMDFYSAWMNEDLVESLGVKPLADDLKQIDALKTHEQVIAYLADMNAAGLDGPFNFSVGQDAKDSTLYVVNFTQSGLGLPNRDFYFDKSERGEELIRAYKSYVNKLLSLAGAKSPAQATELSFALETALAEHQWDKVKNRERELTYNPIEHDSLARMLANVSFERFLEGIGVPAQPYYVVRQPSYFEALNTLFREHSVESWKAYLASRLLTAYAPYLSSDFVTARFNYQKTVFGREEQVERWRKAISSINSNIGETLGQLYVEKHFSSDAKEKMNEMVAYLIKAYEDSIRNLDWMGEETRQKALLKLSKFTPKIGYPDKWEDYSALIVASDDLLGNIKRARIFSHNENVDQLGKPIDKNKWFMAPQSVNAYYNPGLNEIVFPAAYLQPPNYDAGVDDAFNYGAIGVTIGHEIGHGFDDQGSKLDGDGNLISWWTEQDRSEFEKRTRGLVTQFSAYEVSPGLTVNGELTLGENIGDLGGTAIALKAYRMSLEGKNAPVIDGFTGEERFFLGGAQSSRVKWREQFLEYLIKNDPHAPDKARVNGVLSNLPDFYRVFDVKESDGLYIAPKKRVSIW
ncbi:M13 family metallopeptidase [Congregibacter brevis]|uniref:M13 family metallopeptidase n=1 Tax=Congregibacter brevis TaxID=3081201 RepID=A0ABZ0I9H4_9GAMM|nr:M13 family metallopeptidase [Congregibacter sp. IMCC45268]